MIVGWLVSCTGSPIHVSTMSPDELAQTPTYTLCHAYYVLGNEKVKKQLEERKTISDNDWILIESKKVGVGMSEDALVCSWGRPSRINSSGSSRGVSKQYVYRRCQTCRAQYVYVRAGKVVSWQN